MFSTAVIQFSEHNLYDCDMLYIYSPVSLILLQKILIYFFLNFTTKIDLKFISRLSVLYKKAINDFSLSLYNTWFVCLYNFLCFLRNGWINVKHITVIQIVFTELNYCCRKHFSWQIVVCPLNSIIKLQN
jgi:hypothetical protein